ncbi:SigE family RNA polymerase sigma factor [Actinoplanes sp. NPDC004185]
MHAELEESFRAVAAAEMGPLRRFARSLTRDAHHADDLVQGALERMYVVWPRTHSVRDPGAYLRTVLVRLAISESRRPWRREYSTAALPETAYTDTGSAHQLDLSRALTTLSVKQRAIVILRYVEDRSVAEVAEVMRIAEGTVKRQCADAVAKLRRVLGHEFLDDPPEQRGNTRPGALAPAPGGNR